MSQRKVTFQFALMAFLAVTAVACSGSHEGAHEAAQAVEAVEEAGHAAGHDAAAAVDDVLLAAKLAGADLADGTEDHTVSRCPGCSLAMDGSADHALTVKDYELHFCSDSCKGRFEEEAVANIAKLEIPEQ